MMMMMMVMMMLLLMMMMMLMLLQSTAVESTSSVGGGSAGTYFTALNSKRMFYVDADSPSQSGRNWQDVLRFGGSTLRECAATAARVAQGRGALFCYNRGKDGGRCNVYPPHLVIRTMKRSPPPLHGSEDTYYYDYHPDTAWIELLHWESSSQADLYRVWCEDKVSQWKVDSHMWRHPLMDMWGSLAVNQVRLVVYKDHKSVLELLFRASFSNVCGWFNVDRLVKSPWTDVSNDSKDVNMSLFGSDNTMFYIGRRSNHQCDLGKMWLYVANPRVPPCSNNNTHAPNIGFRRPNQGPAKLSDLESADALAIYFNWRETEF